MSILQHLSQLNSSPKQKGMNIAVKVTGFNIDHKNSENNRLTGIRLDTKELVEVCIRNSNSPNQPKITELQSRMAVGGTVMLTGTYPERQQPKLDSDASYLLSTRWATVMVPNSQAGRALFLEARVSMPFLKDNGAVIMTTEIIRDAREVNSLDELEHTFFSNLNPVDNGVYGATPCAGIRIIDFDANGEALDSEMVTFSPAFLQDRFGTDDINATFALYNSPGTPQYEKYQNLKQHLQRAIDSSDTKVEVVKIARFGIGSKTKQGIANKLNSSADMFNWQVMPNLLSSDSNRTGFCKYFIALRPLQGCTGYVCTIAKPMFSDVMGTKSGIATLADKEQFDRRHQAAVPAQQNPAPQQQYQQPQQNWAAEHSYQQPQQNVQGEFKILPAGPGHFAIIPPNIDPSIENSLLETLNSHAHSRVQNGQWIFPESHQPQIVDNLEYAIKVISNGDQRYKGFESEDHQSQENSLDLGAISNEIDSMFPAQADNFGMNR